MKIYGYSPEGIERGDMEATLVEGWEAKAAYGGVESVMPGSWEKGFSRFSDARRSLIRDMKKAEVDEDLVRLVRGMRAADVHADEYGL